MNSVVHLKESSGHAKGRAIRRRGYNTLTNQRGRNVRVPLLHASKDRIGSFDGSKYVFHKMEKENLRNASTTSTRRNPCTRSSLCLGTSACSPCFPTSELQCIKESTIPSICSLKPWCQRSVLSVRVRWSPLKGRGSISP